MAPAPLHGTELIDCAKANGKKGLEVAAQRCGYGNNLEAFEHELRKACDSIGVEIQGFNDLIAVQREGKQGVEIAPESPTQL